MTWTKLDDNFHSHPKTRRIWRDPIALGLYVLALNYSTCHELDGKVPPEFAEDQVPDQSDRDRAVQVLVEVGMWKPNGDGWVIHDYAEYQPSKATLDAKREADRVRKASRRKG